MSAQVNTLVKREVDLGARYTPQSGDTLLTGTQAIARLLVEQNAADRRRGLNTGNFISGYQGSPLAGVDKLLGGMPGVLKASNTVFIPGLNEELAATSVWGSQTELPLGTLSCDAVVGYWYGKGPGFDRASDALRHANLFGVNPKGGAIIFVGDDPASKSSTVPAVSERSISTLGIPVLYPRNAAEVITLGQHAIQISRLSGCVVALKIATDVAEGASIVCNSDCLIEPVIPNILWEGKPWAYEQRVVDLKPGHIQAAEADLLGPRTAAVVEYARLNNLNKVTVSAPKATFGIISTGVTANATEQALHDMGATLENLQNAGIKILRLGLMYPVSADEIREFARGLNTILVVEEKNAFLETLIKEALYGSDSQPVILGKRDSLGGLLIPRDGELTPGRLAAPLKRALESLLPDLKLPAARIPLPILSTSRKPYFCSGCPHNRSTVLPEGSIGGGGIGCHTMVTLEARESSSVTGITQMGGEGAQWIGQAPFTDLNHIFQNVGDGTFFHSGQLAVQACVAAGVNITYKILYNEVVAMTGAQNAEGALPVELLSHKLMSEGVKKIVICSDDPKKYRRDQLASGTAVYHRDRLDEAQKELREIEGVTVLIYDQHCAADARRQRKRGLLPNPSTRVVINEAVCEGCGDCGRKSNCLSVQPVDTDLGRKTQIDQTSCNTDYSCLDGDCPAFMTVEVDPSLKLPKHEILEPPVLPDVPSVDMVQSRNVFIAGIGGTGIVTVNQVLATAAFISGYSVETLDQTGLSQKAGPVTSHLRFSRGDGQLTNRVSEGSADCVLAFDLLTVTTPINLGYVDKDVSTVIASSSKTPTGDMVYDKSLSYPELDTLLERITPFAKTVHYFDALKSAENLIGNTENANFLIVGAACQSGALGLSPEAIEEAITLNGVSVEENLMAFRWGRAFVTHTAEFASATEPEPKISERGYKVSWDLSDFHADLHDLIADRADRLTGFQNKKTAKKYIDILRRIYLAEKEFSSTVFTEQVARYLYKLTAYKDEYEVARLLTLTDDTEKALQAVPGGKKLTYRLHPPMLRAVGRDKKIGFTPSTHFSLRFLARLKWLRGTPLDVFGYAKVRRVERELVRHYETTVLMLAAALDAESIQKSARIAALPDLVRGYEDIKLSNVEVYVTALEAEGMIKPEV